MQDCSPCEVAVLIDVWSNKADAEWLRLESSFWDRLEAEEEWHRLQQEGSIDSDLELFTHLPLQLWRTCQGIVKGLTQDELANQLMEQTLTPFLHLRILEQRHPPASALAPSSSHMDTGGYSLGRIVCGTIPSVCREAALKQLVERCPATWQSAVPDDLQKHQFWGVILGSLPFYVQARTTFLLLSMSCRTTTLFCAARFHLFCSVDVLEESGMELVGVDKLPFVHLCCLPTAFLRGEREQRLAVCRPCDACCFSDDCPMHAADNICQTQVDLAKSLTVMKPEGEAGHTCPRPEACQLQARNVRTRLPRA